MYMDVHVCFVMSTRTKYKHVFVLTCFVVVVFVLFVLFS